jgi:hypothetical protein
MDIIVDEIRRCYVEMDKFWVDEVRRVTKAFEDRRIDPEDIDRWKASLAGLEKTMAHWEVRVSLRRDSSAFRQVYDRQDLPVVQPQCAAILHILCV